MKKMFTLLAAVVVMATATTPSRAATVDDLQKQINYISDELKTLKNEAAKEATNDSKNQPNSMRRIINKSFSQM